MLQILLIWNTIDIGSSDLRNSIQTVVYPKQFNGDYIFVVEPNFTNALKSIIDRSGRKDNVGAMFIQRLRYLNEKKTLVFIRSDWFESSKGYKNIYFMKIKEKDFNIRISFVFRTYKNKEYAILVSAFAETKKGNAKTSSYSNHVDSIIPIIETIEEMFKNGK